MSFLMKLLAKLKKCFLPNMSPTSYLKSRLVEQMVQTERQCCENTKT